MSNLHEKRKSLNPELLDRHRAIESLREELEAVDWYDQRAAATEDDELRAVLEHNRDEEMEHAAMLIEWLRRRSTGWAEQIGTYVDSNGPIAEVEHGGPGAAPPSLGLGGARGED